MKDAINTPTTRPQLIGIAGTFSSGKDTLAKRLQSDFGYAHVSTSDIVREVAMRERGSIERPVLYKTADKYRKQYGAGAFVAIALEKSRPLVVTGLRSLGEAKVIRENGGTLMFIDAPVEARYERMKSRARDGEILLSLDEFRAFEETELYAGPTDTDFNLRGIKAMADVVIENTLPLEDYIALAYRKLGLK